MRCCLCADLDLGPDPLPQRGQKRPCGGPAERVKRPPALSGPKEYKHKHSIQGKHFKASAQAGAFLLPSHRRRVFSPLRRRRRHGCGALFLLRPSLRACKKQTAAPAPLRLFLPQAAPQLRSPARVGGSPLRRFAPALPEGEPSLRPWTEKNFVVRRTFFAAFPYHKLCRD